VGVVTEDKSSVPTNSHQQKKTVMDFNGAGQIPDGTNIILELNPPHQNGGRPV
jgi:hypothetical protein